MLQHKNALSGDGVEKRYKPGHRKNGVKKSYSPTLLNRFLLISETVSIGEAIASPYPDGLLQ
ncbi:hypothetical protein BFV94_4624 [Alteromonas macleodii]|uniref:Transposase n=1 Tax=Alteromonas macleodii TaxID=28108 RepID=A0AB36FP85_ALTMA|nr:hypothetical protein BFV93_4844 [Alteromonas macleodii]OES24875.1 hypothetical protein BFV95_4634 [Alteromonas macleodii]OES25153.1 hypothetical protein BFV94_4624 [Alteromonas macleodii]OES39194.1 hypothetical protein BFV96_4342 [Alteromonas macleodii]